MRTKDGIDYTAIYVPNPSAVQGRTPEKILTREKRQKRDMNNSIIPFEWGHALHNLWPKFICTFETFSQLQSAELQTEYLRNPQTKAKLNSFVSGGMKQAAIDCDQRGTNLFQIILKDAFSTI